MDGLAAGSVVQFLEEGFQVDWLDPTQRDAQVGALIDPWIAEEGPVSARLSRRLFSEGPLLPRGLAFDGETTVHWDEDGVQVVRSAAADPGTLAMRQAVQVVQPQHLDDWGLPKGMHRIDYLQQGVCVASRYEIGLPNDNQGEPHA